MPQASDELRALWGGELGVGEDKAMNHLTERGFYFSRGGFIFPPEGKSWETISYDDRNAVQFLCDEWDYAFAERITGAKP